MKDSTYFDKLQSSDIADLFTEAENAIKGVELECNELIIPAINELRYAGFHLKEYIKNPELVDEIRKAEGNCKRAIYDAHEASILYYLKEFHKFKDDYRKVIISQVVPDYNKYRQRIAEIIESIKSVDKEQRDTYYRACKSYNDELRDIVANFDASRDELDKLIRKERREWLILICAVAAIIISIISIFV